MLERGQTAADVEVLMNSTRDDFTRFVEPQKETADIIIQVLLSKSDDGSGKTLRVRFIQDKAAGLLSPAALLHEQESGTRALMAGEQAREEERRRHCKN